ncbi:hypothetical protein [Rhizobium lentis]|uniref:hypothetical protein n=1 Tax=Rhizobium lentis TaxID=1138194 RepID=UPI001A91B532|nr:hypothetical protein [Rhizobium lentis]MBX4999255.1 hypothetical protein [Rhizobium lentis]MBX5011137.1 hypothetical protein [Rhizobium lentis]MBX5015455.1 hypothetical protein [Rhizobium lentis]MBX5067060.1 hypothetical protein [Rhizobium lentis]MBX5078519.1 hypothetical protein [Rhizobium lentis]
MIRIWAGHAVSPQQFAFSIGELRDEDPQSIVLTYNEGNEMLWGFAELPRTIKSITSIIDSSDGKPVFVPMSNEGDVYFLIDDIPVEKIAGAGVLSDDSVGYGALSRIADDHGKLYACGYGSQLYERRQEDDWRRLCDFDLPGVEDCAFFGMAIKPGSGPVALCGQKRVQYNDPTAAQQAEIDRARAQGDAEGAEALLERFRTIRVPPSTALYLRTDGWTEAVTDARGGLNDCIVMSAGQVAAVGDHGFIVRATGPSVTEDLSSIGLTEDLYTIRLWRGDVAILGAGGIHVFDKAFAYRRTIGLPPELNTPNKMDVVEGDIVLFDYSGVAILKDDQWKRIPIPDDMWNLAN